MYTFKFHSYRKRELPFHSRRVVKKMEMSFINSVFRLYISQINVQAQFFKEKSSFERDPIAKQDHFRSMFIPNLKR